MMGENANRCIQLEVVLTVISDEENIATMHAFVNMLDFKDLPFVDALRTFLQPFRLPGEAQKSIDSCSSLPSDISQEIQKHLLPTLVCILFYADIRRG